jgi:hypothetical protein
MESNGKFVTRSGKRVDYSTGTDQTFFILLIRVVDPDSFNTYPDPAFLLNPDPLKLKQNFRRQFPSQILLKSKFELNQIKNTGVIHQKFFKK